MTLAVQSEENYFSLFIVNMKMHTFIIMEVQDEKKAKICNFFFYSYILFTVA